MWVVLLNKEEDKILGQLDEYVIIGHLFWLGEIGIHSWVAQLSCYLKTAFSSFIVAMLSA